MKTSTIKKILTTMLLVIIFATTTIALISCLSTSPDTDIDYNWYGEYVETTDTDGQTVEVSKNPTIAAFYDYASLDTLFGITGDKFFEITGLKKIVVPSKENLPDALGWFRDQPNTKVVSGGTLFYVDMDILEGSQAQQIILGGRAFGQDSEGATVDSATGLAAAQKAMPNARFIRLKVNTNDSKLTDDMTSNALALSTIFSNMSQRIIQTLNTTQKDIQEIGDIVRDKELTGLFVMTPATTTMSVFGPKSRFDMLYEEFGFKPAIDITDGGDQHGAEVSKELILQVNPPVIFVLDRAETTGSESGFNNFANDEIIKQTQAAKDGNIYKLSGDQWYTFTGGLRAVRTMINDIKQYTDQL